MSGSLNSLLLEIWTKISMLPLQPSNVWKVNIMLINFYYFLHFVLFWYIFLKLQALRGTILNVSIFLSITATGCDLSFRRTALRRGYGYIYTLEITTPVQQLGTWIRSVTLNMTERDFRHPWGINHVRLRKWTVTLDKQMKIQLYVDLL